VTAKNKIEVGAGLWSFS